VGSIFSVLRARRAAGDVGARLPAAGRAQVCAGYAIYGPTTMLVLTFGNGTHGFTLDREIGEFIYTHPICACPRTRASSPSTPRTRASGSRR
jgi:fructose-1,6-bisphosphatase I / sedoheptulose-1,7-bisphosphatase